MVTLTKRGQSSFTPYSHQAWELKRNSLRLLMRIVVFPWMIRMGKVDGLENIPREGPALILMNHIAFVDPIVVMHVLPRNIVPLAKIEVYDYPVVGIFPKLWGVIPVRRNEIDRRAIRQAIDVLNAGELVLVAPEGTRNDSLRRGKEGIAYLAGKTGAPVVPVALEGTPGFPTYPFSKRWRGEKAVIRVGKPFRYKQAFRNARAKTLRKMTDEAMYILAGMLPEHRRGVYENLEDATMDTIEWVDPV